MKFLSRYTRHNVPEPGRKGLDAAGIVLANYFVYGDIQRIVHGVTWITIFGSRVRLFANNFHEWRSHEWKSLANRITSDHNIVIHGKECIILFLTRYFMSWTHNSSKNNYRSLISPLSLWTVFSVLALWPHHYWSVTSRKHGVLELWCHIRRLFLHVQIGAKAIFTVE